MKHLIFTALFLLSYTVAVRAQIVFPTPNQVEMQTGNLILGKKVSMYAEDTTAFYLNLFREEVLSHTPIKWQKKESKADICWITDSSLPPEGYRIRIHPQQMVISASDKGGFTYAVQTLRQWVAGSAGSITFAWRKRDGLSLHTVALLLTGLRTSVPKGCHHQKVYRHGFTAQNELLPLASDRRTGMAHRNQAISAPHPDWRFGRQRRRQQGFYTQEEIRDIIEYAVNGISPSSPK